MLNQGLGIAVHLVGSRWNGRHPIRLRHKPRLGARGEFGRLGGGKRFVSFLDSVSLRWNKHLSPCRSHTSELRLGPINEHLLVGPWHKREWHHRGHWCSQRRDSRVCNGARSAQPNTQANSKRYTHGDSDTCAKSYSYTKGAPHCAAATVVGTVEQACRDITLAAGTAAATVSSDIADTAKKLVSISVHSWLQRRSTLALRSRPSLIMNETHREDPHAPLSYYGARRIVSLIFFIFIIWLMLRALQPVILLFALVLSSRDGFEPDRRLATEIPRTALRGCHPGDASADCCHDDHHPVCHSAPEPTTAGADAQHAKHVARDSHPD